MERLRAVQTLPCGISWEHSNNQAKLHQNSRDAVPYESYIYKLAKQENGGKHHRNFANVDSEIPLWERNSGPPTE